MSQANITIPVDLTNPGQFFACCGLLELADRLWPGAEVTGGFSSPGFHRSIFSIRSKAGFGSREVIEKLLSATPEAVAPHRPICETTGKPVADPEKTKPVMIGPPISLRLNWWLDEIAGKQTAFKLWGSHQTSIGLINDMVSAIVLDQVFDDSVLQLSKGMTGRIGLDIRSSWNALSEGFSPNDQNFPVDTYAATELLAAVGLTTFRPTLVKDGYSYACWLNQLPTIVARAVASGSVSLSGLVLYRFSIGTRGKFKFLTKASQLERIKHD
jgi:CRISPR-associated protein Csx14